MNDLIRRIIAAQYTRLGPQLAVGFACVSGASLVRVLIGFWIPAGIPYVTFFPVLLLATLLGGLRSGVVTLLTSMVAGAVFFVEPLARWPLPSSTWTAMVAFLISGGLIVWLSHLVTTAFRAVEEARQQERLLVLELQHRVKNTLSIVQALAAQTFTSNGGDARSKGVFVDRLVALGRAHNVLSETAWRDVTMQTLVTQAMEPFVGARSKRISMQGEDMLLRSTLIIDLALCLHELATNAMKHGALSTKQGVVEIRWRRVSDQRVELTWRETGGPPVSPPAQRGFGSRLLNQGLSRSARPLVSTDYAPDGLRWTAQFDATLARAR